MKEIVGAILVGAAVIMGVVIIGGGIWFAMNAVLDPLMPKYECPEGMIQVGGARPIEGKVGCAIPATRVN